MPDDHVYLTFDDGPSAPATPELLQFLRRFEIKATFFVRGQQAEKHPEIVARAYEQGHTIGNHSYSHPHMVCKRGSFLYQEVMRTDNIIETITGSRPTLFRPPFGRFAFGLIMTLRRTGHEIVLWSASGADYKSGANPASIHERLIHKHRPGEIILLHDSHECGPKTLKALDRLVREFVKKGVTFAPLPVQ